MLLKKCKIFLDYNEYNLVKSRDNTFKLDRFDEWLQTKDYQTMTQDFVEQSQILKQEWNDCKQEAFMLNWNQNDRDQVIAKIDDNKMDIKFIDQVINYKIGFMNTIMFDQIVMQNEHLKRVVLLGIIFATIATNAPKTIEFHVGEEFNWKGITNEYRNMDLEHLTDFIESLKEQDDD